MKFTLNHNMSVIFLSNNIHLVCHAYSLYYLTYFNRKSFGSKQCTYEFFKWMTARSKLPYSLLQSVTTGCGAILLFKKRKGMTVNLRGRHIGFKLFPHVLDDCFDVIR